MTAQPINTLFRDWITDGVPASTEHWPIKPDIRDTFNALLLKLTGANAGALIETSKTNLDALTPADKTMGWVVGDANPDLDGVYQYSGAVWTKRAPLPYSVIQLNNANAGTANAIQVTTAVGIPSAAFAALYVLNVTAANTGAVTVAINANPAVPLVTNTNQPIASGYLKAGMAVQCVDDGTSLRLLSYGDASAVQAAAEAAQAAAETAKGGAEAAAALAAQRFVRVRAVTTANVDLATELENGDTADGIALVTGDLVLVAGQTAAEENGVYLVPAAGAATRSSQFNTYDSHPGSHFAVMEGTANADTLWRCTSATGGTLDTTAIVFSGQFNSNNGMFVSGSISGSGIASSAATAEFQNDPDAGITLYRTGPANTINECFLAGFSKDAGGGVVKTFSISENFFQTAAADRFSVLRLNATFATGGVGADYLGVRIMGGRCVTINGLSDTDMAETITGTQDKMLIRNGVIFAMPGAVSEVHQRFVNNSVAVGGGVSRGTIATNGTGTAYNVTSDKRLKIDDGEVSSADARRVLDLIKVHNFRWKDNDLKDQGFFAQELHKIYPRAVTPGTGRPGKKGFDPWAVDQAKLMPIVIRCLQVVSTEHDETKAELARAKAELALVNARQDDFEKRMAALERKGERHL